MPAFVAGKTSMLAQIMRDSGTVVALDRTHSKVQQVQDLANDWSVSCINAMVADATQLYQEDQPQKHLQDSSPEQYLQETQQQQQQGSQLSLALHGSQSPGQLQHTPSPLSSGSSSRTAPCSSSSINGHGSSVGDGSDSTPKKRKRRRSSSSGASPPRLSPEVAAAVTPEGFDYILLDAPCSALGLRPRLLVDWSLPALQKLASYQRALLHSAVHCLRPGGKLVYCTCTINPGKKLES